MKHTLYTWLAVTMLTLSLVQCHTKKAENPEAELRILKKKLASLQNNVQLRDDVNKQKDDLLELISQSLDSLDLGQDSLQNLLQNPRDKTNILAKIAQVNEVAARSKEKIATLEKLLAEQKQQNPGLLQLLENLKTKLANTEAENAQLKAQVSNLKNNVASLEYKVQVGDRKLSRVKTQLDQTEDKFSKSRADLENEQFRAVNAQINKELNNAALQWRLGQKTSRLTNAGTKWNYYQKAYNSLKKALDIYQENRHFAIRFKFTKSFIENKIRALKDDIPAGVKRRQRVVFY